MAGREVREYTNLSDPKDKKWGKGKERIDDEDITFQRMVAKVILITCPGRDPGFSYWVGDVHRCKKLQENVVAIYMDVAINLRIGLGACPKFNFAALDSDDLLYLKEQMEAEEDAERILRRTEKRAFAAFKKAASLADSSPASVPLPLRVAPKPKSGIRQQDLIKKVVEVKPKRQRVGSEHGKNEASLSVKPDSASQKPDANVEEKISPNVQSKAGDKVEIANPFKSLLSAYESSDDED